VACVPDRQCQPVCMYGQYRPTRAIDEATCSVSIAYWIFFKPVKGSIRSMGHQHSCTPGELEILEKSGALTKCPALGY
jgi:hypothetical protein